MREHLRAVPVLLAITWTAVAAVRIHQLLSQRHNGTSALTQLWSIGTLTLLALLYLAYSTVTSRSTSRRMLMDAYRSLSRVERLTDLSLSQLPTEELLPALLDRVCEALEADGGSLMLTLPEGDLEVAATAGASRGVPVGAVVARGDGLGGRIAATGKVVVVEDVSRGEVVRPELRENVASAAGAPLVANGAVIGVLLVVSRTRRTFDDDDVHVLQLAAERCASAIEAARLRDAERRNSLGAEHARRHLRLLVEASRIFMESVSDHEPALVRLVELAAQEFAGFGAVYLAEGSGLRLLVAQQVMTGPNDDMVAFRQLSPAAMVPVREAMATGRPMMVKSLDDGDYELALGRLGVTSYVVVPITVRGLAFGALVFGTVGAMRGYRPSDLAAAEELGRRAALAVEASLLYRDAHDSATLAESHARRMRNLLDTWLAIGPALDGPDGLQVAAAGARRILEAENAFVVVDGITVSADLARRVPSESVWRYLRGLRRPARQDDPDHSPLPDDAAAELGPAWIAAPLRDPVRQVDGIVVVTGKSGAGGFGAEDESLLVLLAQMVSVGLANALLHRTTRENEARLQALIEASPVGIVDLTLDMEVRSWNRAAARLFDWPAQPGSGWYASFEPQMHGWVESLKAATDDTGEPATIECTFTREDGERKALSLSLSPVYDARDSVTGLLLVANDETERRQLARQFQEAQRLDAVGRMAGAIAHDFNNLLTIILGYADGLLRRMPEDNPHRERIAAISRAGHRGAALTRQLLAVSRRQVVAPIVIRPVDVFAELADMVGRLIGEDIHVHVNGDGDDRAVRIDKGQLEQVLLNLAANARDAMQYGGELFLETAVGPDPSYVAIRVRDTGVGMDEETLAHCLEPFFTTKERGEGTGLGLAAVYGIVTQSGGELTITSSPGHGTTVSILLPAVDAPLEYAPAVELPTPTSVAPPASGCILLVEDELEVRSLVRRMLRERGYTVLQAASARQAMAMLNEYQGALDLLITDVVMPGMKGPELAQRIAMERQVPVLFMSGYAEELATMPEGVEAPVGYVAKPFTPEQLLAEVGRLMVGPRVTARTDIPRPAPSEASEAHPGSLRSSS